MSQVNLRAVYLPIQLQRRHLTCAVYYIVDLLSEGSLSDAQRALEELTLGSHDLECDKRTQEGEHNVLRARLLMRVFIDLYESGWTFTRDGNEVYGIAPIWEKTSSTEGLVLEKMRARKAVKQRRTDNLSSSSTQRLIHRLEVPQGDTLSVKALIADGKLLASRLTVEGSAAVQPYLQLARPEDGLDQHTGLKLYDCFKYFRGYWSFPYETTPGRRLPILIRDAAQPHHPVCGLLCFVSPLPQLASRDNSFGWSSGWLEAVIAAIDTPSEGDIIKWLSSAWGRLSASLDPKSAPSPSALATDLSALFNIKLSTPSLKALIKSLRPFGEEYIKRIFDDVRLRLAQHITSIVKRNLESLSFEGLGVTLNDLTTSTHPLATLEGALAQAEREWRALRATQTRGDVREEVKYRRKRARLALSLAEAWWDLEPLCVALTDGGERLKSTLRVMSGGRASPWGVKDEPLSGGRGMSIGLQRALRLHKVDMISSRVADLSVCGAIEPYRALLGGKLASMMALSGEAVRLYQSVYEKQISEIQSHLAGRSVTRSSDLNALVTTSFYAVGSAQYNRVSLPPELGGARWVKAGMSDGQGTMHFSHETTALMSELLSKDERSLHPSSDFGSGPSERLRKIRDALTALGLPASELLTHGMSRIVYVARLSDECLFSAQSERQPYAQRGPSVDEVVECWRSRWLTPRLRRSGVLSELAMFDSNAHLLSLQIPSAATSLKESPH